MSGPVTKLHWSSTGKCLGLSANTGHVIYVLWRERDDLWTVWEKYDAGEQKLRSVHLKREWAAASLARLFGRTVTALLRETERLAP